MLFHSVSDGSWPRENAQALRRLRIGRYRAGMAVFRHTFSRLAGCEPRCAARAFWRLRAGPAKAHDSAVYAPIAAISGLMPIMFITRVGCRRARAEPFRWRRAAASSSGSALLPSGLCRSTQPVQANIRTTFLHSALIGKLSVSWRSISCALKNSGNSAERLQL